VARKLRVRVDHATCVGNAMCEAAESCPVSAIFVEDAETGEQLFP